MSWFQDLQYPQDLQLSNNRVNYASDRPIFNNTSLFSVLLGGTIDPFHYLCRLSNLALNLILIPSLILSPTQNNSFSSNKIDLRADSNASLPENQVAAPLMPLFTELFQSYILGLNRSSFVTDTTLPQAAQSCPRLFRPLIHYLLQDLPGYANRALIRSRTAQDPRIYILAIGKPDFRSLPLDSLGATFPESDLESLAGMEYVQQVFLTVLERRYFESDLQPGDSESRHLEPGDFEGEPGLRQEPAAVSREQQQFHWLFFQWSPEGWQLLKMFSQTGAYPWGYDPLTPPRDSSEEPLAEAIRLQLHDCQVSGDQISAGE